jgi:GT2 family glycosyltransferase
MSDATLYQKLRWHAGRGKRWLRRKAYERSVGKAYRIWLASTEGATPQTIENTNTIAVIIPVYNPPLAFLQECLDSVLNQTARNWQLVVSDDGSTAPEVIDYLDQFTAQHANDQRITVIRGENGGISAAQNRALDVVTTEYFGWLDHDDRLNPTAFEVFSQTIDNNPEAQIIYSDEDKIDTKGKHFELYCKPDFSPELLLTQMYLCHFTVFRTALVKAVSGFRSEMDGAQDFDLALRLLPNLTNVIHIPLPLYHWRSWSESTAQSIDAKPWAQQSAARAQTDFINVNYGGGEVAPSAVKGLNQVHPKIMKPTKVSVIIPTIGTKDPKSGIPMVNKAIQTLREAETQTEFEVIVVTTGELAPIPGADQQIVYNTTNFNFAEAINLGRTAASGEYLLLLNDDTTVAEPEPITRLLEVGQNPGVGITGAKLTYPDGRLQHVGMVMLPSGPTHPWIAKSGNEYGYFGATLTPRNYSAVTAAAFLVRTEFFDQLNGFDTAFARDFNDVDFCLRMRELGYRVAWTPYAHFTHHEGASIIRKKADPTEAQLFARRWNAKYQVDPYYSVALKTELDRMYEAK